MSIKMESRFQCHYKRNSAKNKDTQRYKRVQDNLENRRASRAAEYSKNRNLDGMKVPTRSNRQVVDERKLKLLKWKEQKKQEKLLKKAQAKPIFRCGVVQHSVGSPFRTEESNRSSKKALKSAKTVKPMSAQKNKSIAMADQVSFAPSNYKFKAPIGVWSETSTGKKTSAVAVNSANTETGATKRVTRSQTRANSGNQEEAKLPVNRKQRKNYKKAASHPTPMEDIAECGVADNNSGTSLVPLATNAVISSPVATNAEVMLSVAESRSESNTPECKQNSPSYPIQYSPFVNFNRGSGNRSQRPMSSSAHKSNDGESPSQHLNRSKSCSSVSLLNTEEERLQHGILYFRSVLKSESDRLQAECQKWLHIQSTAPDLTAEASDLIRAAVGQTSLLINKKFSQFHDLIDACEKGGEEEVPSVTFSDLDGFWDMVYMQVENVDIRFNKLQKMKENNWTEETENLFMDMKQLKKVHPKKKKEQKTKSSLHDVIAAARNKKKALQENDSNKNMSEKDACPKLVQTPVRTALVARRLTLSGQHSPGVTPSAHLNRSSLLQQAVSGARRQSIRTSTPIIMKVSRMAKMSEDGIQTPKIAESSETTCRPVLQKTPAKSILKSISNILLNSSPKEESFKEVMVVNSRESAKETKENVVAGPSHSPRKSKGQKVRFEAITDSSPKAVQPMTPYAPHSAAPRKRRSSRISSLVKLEPSSSVTPSASGDLISFDSPPPEPPRVHRRSLRLSTQTR